MCGIVVRLQEVPIPVVHESDRFSVVNDSIWSSIKNTVTRRGPDGQNAYSTTIQTTKRLIKLDCFGSVLHLRGPTVEYQPFVDVNSGSFLLFNGEIYDTGLDECGIAVDKNDGRWLFEKLIKGSSVISIIETIEGPFAFVWYAASERTLYYGRDILGRRSLLLTSCLQDDDGVFYISSVAGPASNFDRSAKELIPGMIHKIAFETEIRPQVESISSDNLPTISSRFCQQDDLTLVNPTDNRLLLQNFEDVLSEAVKTRVLSLNRLHEIDPQAYVSVLFSGGLDCTTLALLADLHLPDGEPVDLINVAFRNTARTNRQDFNTPDRQTAVLSLAELRDLCPRREWRLIFVNVDQSEASEVMARIHSLIQPNNTVMDSSLATALWFAARGRGHLMDGRSYHSEARVMISGLGADELLGGYRRHRLAWERGGNAKLAEELKLDLDRLPYRNLGRDDRVLSDHGKEVRYPFLASEVVKLLSRVEPQSKCNFASSLGLGDKSLLRALAESRGLTRASKLTKRAMQFGSRSTCLQPNGQKGTDQVTK